MANGTKAPTVTLIGPKHCGKTSVGTALAAACGGVFVDLDDAIRERTGRSPRELYEAGPDLFRRAEAQAAEAVFSEEARRSRGGSPLVAAAGGGMADNPPALAAARAAGSIVALEVPVDLAWQRITASAARDGALPPFLRVDDPRAAHAALHDRRAAACRRTADIVVDAGTGSPEEVAGAVARALGWGSPGRCPP